MSAIWQTPSTAIPFKPAPARVGKERCHESEHERDDDEAGVVADHDRECLDHVGDARRAVDAEIRDDRAGERQRLAPQAGDGRGGEHAGERLQRAPRPAACGLHGEREERDRSDRREQRPGDERGARRVRRARRPRATRARALRRRRRPPGRRSRAGTRARRARVARPRRGVRIVAAAAASASSSTSPGGQNGSSAAANVTVTAASAPRMRVGARAGARQLPAFGAVVDLAWPRGLRAIAPRRGERRPERGCESLRRRALRGLDRECRRDGAR